MQDQRERLLEISLRLIEKEFYLIPLHSPRSDGSCSCEKLNCPNNGKHPRISRWQEQSTIDPEIVKGWFQKFDPMNIGIVTGEKSNCLVIDIDNRNGGDVSWAEIENNLGPIIAPSTQTGGGGFHKIFQYPQGCSKLRSKLAKGIDVKINGGFVVGPWSLHKSGKHYEPDKNINLLNTALPTLPVELLEILQHQDSRGADVIWLNPGKKIPKGDRNNSLFRLGCILRKKGLTPDSILLTLASENERRSEEPLPISEVETIAANVFKYSQEPSEDDVICPYEYEDSGTYFVERKGDKLNRTRLANFVAKIPEERTIDDGLNTRTVFVIEAVLENGKSLPTLEVLAEEFQGLNWITSRWGSKPIIDCGYATKDRLRVAILENSRTAVQTRIFTHTGFTNIENQYIYVHGGGAIRESGNDPSILFDGAEGQLNNYVLPDPVTGTSLVEAVNASMLMIQAAPSHTSLPLFSGVYLAPLNEVLPIDFTNGLFGPTGTLKTSLMAIVQAHSGIHFNIFSLPESWTSTPNALERKMFLAKDMPFIVDDFVPELIDPYAVDRILRNHANKQGRSRMTKDGSLQITNYSRSALCVTGEGVPSGASLRARIFVNEVAPNDIDKKVLTELQNYAHKRLFSQAFSSYIRWLIPQMDNLKNGMAETYQELRNQFHLVGKHQRTASSVASLAFGFKTFTRFAMEVKAISKINSEALLDEGLNALKAASERQVNFHLSEDPVERFLESLRAAFVMGRAYLEDSKTGGRPSSPEKWGWLQRGGEWFNPGLKIGWLTEKEIWLHPEAAFTVAVQVARAQDMPIPISKETLWKRLLQKGYILNSPSEQKNLIKRTLPGGGRSRLLIISDYELLEASSAALPAPKAPLAPGELPEHLQKYAQLIANKNGKDPDGIPQ